MKVLDRSGAKELLSSIETFLLDCDGVLFKGKTVFPQVPESLAHLEALGKQVFYVTNNSTGSRRKYAGKLGLPITQLNMYNSAYVTAKYVAERVPPNSKVFVIGEEGLFDELREVGLTPLGGPEFERRDYNCDHFDADPEVRAVIVGFDRHATYHKFTYAYKCVAEHGALFVATNTDAQFPLENSLIPGGGCFVAFLAHALQRQPVVVGKPEAPMFDIIQHTAPRPIDKSSTIMVGDRLDTDILFGKNAGIRTVLVLSGVTSLEQALNAPEHLRPDYIVDYFSWLSGLDPI